MSSQWNGMGQRAPRAVNPSSANGPMQMQMGPNGQHFRPQYASRGFSGFHHGDTMPQFEQPDHHQGLRFDQADPARVPQHRFPSFEPHAETDAPAAPPLGSRIESQATGYLPDMSPIQQNQSSEVASDVNNRLAAQGTLRRSILSNDPRGQAQGRLAVAENELKEMLAQARHDQVAVRSRFLATATETVRLAQQRESEEELVGLNQRPVNSNIQYQMTMKNDRRAVQGKNQRQGGVRAGNRMFANVAGQEQLEPPRWGDQHNGQRLLGQAGATVQSQDQSRISQTTAVLDFSLLSAIHNEGDDQSAVPHQAKEHQVLGRAESLQKNRIFMVSPMGDSPLLRTVTAVEKMKMQEGEKNVIMEKDEMENEQLSSNDRVSESQRSGSKKSPSKEEREDQNTPRDEAHTKRMQSFVVRKVTKIYDKRNTSSLVSHTDSVLSAKRQHTVYDQNQKLSQCKLALEFFIVAICKSFDIHNPVEAAHFIAEIEVQDEFGGTSTQSLYTKCLQDVDNFQKINNFLSLLQTNLKYLIQLLEQENDLSMYLGRGGQGSQPQIQNEFKELLTDTPRTEESSLYIIMNLLTLGLSMSVDERIVWQTCNLLSGIVQFINGVSVNQGFQSLFIQWALNRDTNDKQRYESNCWMLDDFISRCLVSRQKHQIVNSPIIKLFYEVANLGRERRNILRPKENLILYDLFMIIIPRYFKSNEEHIYLELIEDTVASHLFQFEKDRVDKQYLLYQQIDKCFSYLLEFVQESKKVNSYNAPANGYLHKAKQNVYLQNINVLFSIWQNNGNLLKLTVSQFLSAFMKLVKTIQQDQKNMIKSLNFNYERFGKDSQMEKIALRLIEKNLKKAGCMFKMAIVVKMQEMIEFFQRSQENKKEEFMIQMVAGVFFGKSAGNTRVNASSNELVKESALSQWSDQETALRQNVSLYLHSYFSQNESTETVNWFIEEYMECLNNLMHELLIQQTGHSADTQQLLIFNDHQLLETIIFHQKLSTESQVLLYDLLSQIIFIEQFTDFMSMQSASVLLQQLFRVSENELSQYWMSLIKYGCMDLTKIEVNILNCQNEGLPTHHLKIKRHVIFKCVQGLITLSEETYKEKGNLLHFSKQFLGSLSELPNSPKTITHLKEVLDQKVKLQDQKIIEITDAQNMVVSYRTKKPTIGNQHQGSGLQLPKSPDGGKLKQELTLAVRNKNKSNEYLRNYQGETVEAGDMNMQALGEVGKAEKAANAKKMVSPLNLKVIKQGNAMHLQAVDKAKASQAMLGNTGSRNAIQSTLRFENQQENRQQNFEMDIEDQSLGTTLRTEIYTSEDEEEMINYHAVISDYKKSFKEQLVEAESEGYQTNEFQGKPKLEYARDTGEQDMKDNRADQNRDTEGEPQLIAEVRESQEEKDDEILPTRSIAEDYKQRQSQIIMRTKASLKQYNPVRAEGVEQDQDVTSVSGVPHATGDVLKDAAEVQDKKQESTMFDTWKGKFLEGAAEPAKEDPPAPEADPEARLGEEPQQPPQESDRQVYEERKSDAADQQLPGVTEVKIVQNVAIFQDQNAPPDNGMRQTNDIQFMGPLRDSTDSQQMQREGHGSTLGEPRFPIDGSGAGEEEDELPRTRKKQASQDKKMVIINKQQLPQIKKITKKASAQGMHGLSTPGNNSRHQRETPATAKFGKGRLGLSPSSSDQKSQRDLYNLSFKNKALHSSEKGKRSAQSRHSPVESKQMTQGSSTLQLPPIAGRKRENLPPKIPRIPKQAQKQRQTAAHNSAPPLKVPQSPTNEGPDIIPRPKAKAKRRIKDIIQSNSAMANAEPTMNAQSAPADSKRMRIRTIITSKLDTASTPNAKYTTAWANHSRSDKRGQKQYGLFSEPEKQVLSLRPASKAEFSPHRLPASIGLFGSSDSAPLSAKSNPPWLPTSNKARQAQLASLNSRTPALPQELPAKKIKILTKSLDKDFKIKKSPQKDEHLEHASEPDIKKPNLKQFKLKKPQQVQGRRLPALKVTQPQMVTLTPSNQSAKLQPLPGSTSPPHQYQSEPKSRKPKMFQAKIKALAGQQRNKPAKKKAAVEVDPMGGTDRQQPPEIVVTAAKEGDQYEEVGRRITVVQRKSGARRNREERDGKVEESKTEMVATLQQPEIVTHETPTSDNLRNIIIRKEEESKEAQNRPEVAEAANVVHEQPIIVGESKMFSSVAPSTQRQPTENLQTSQRAQAAPPKPTGVEQEQQQKQHVADQQQPREGNILNLNPQMLHSQTNVAPVQMANNTMHAATLQTLPSRPDLSSIGGTFSSLEQQPLPGQIFTSPPQPQPFYQLAPPLLIQPNPTQLLLPNQLMHQQSLIQPLQPPMVAANSFNNMMQRQVEDFYQKTMMDYKEFMQWKDQRKTSTAGPAKQGYHQENATSRIEENTSEDGVRPSHSETKSNIPNASKSGRRQHAAQRRKRSLASSSSSLGKIQASFKFERSIEPAYEASAPERPHKTATISPVQNPDVAAQNLHSSSAGPPLQRQKSQFQQILDQQEVKKPSVAMQYARQLSKFSTRTNQWKEDVKEEFTQQLERTRIDPEKLELMRQKSMSRANYLRKQQTIKSQISRSDVSEANVSANMAGPQY